MGVFDILSVSKRCTSSFGHERKTIIGLESTCNKSAFVVHIVMKSVNQSTTFNDFKLNTKHDSGKGLSNHCVLVGQGQVYQPV